MDYKLGFIGAGNMATAILSGAVSSKALPAKNIYVYDTVTEKADDLHAKYKVNVAPNLDALVKSSDIVLLAIKPNVAKSVLNSINFHWWSRLVNFSCQFITIPPTKVFSTFVFMISSSAHFRRS